MAKETFCKRVRELHKLGHSYDEIVEIVGCSKATVCYYISDTYHEKNRIYSKKHKNSHPYVRKISRFRQKEDKSNNVVSKNKERTYKDRLCGKISGFFSKSNNGRKYVKYSRSFSVKDLVAKIGETPTCVLTGKIMDIKDTYAYHLDHKFPRSRGGDNSLDNLQVLSREANMAKNDMTNEEFIQFCVDLLEYQGFTVTKNEVNDSL